MTPSAAHERLACAPCDDSSYSHLKVVVDFAVNMLSGGDSVLQLRLKSLAFRADLFAACARNYRGDPHVRRGVVYNVLLRVQVDFEKVGADSGRRAFLWCTRSELLRLHIALIGSGERAIHPVTHGASPDARRP